MAALGNFFFFTMLAAFFLLPLHLKQLGVTETGLGLIMGTYSATAIFCQPVIGAWVDRAGRRPFMLVGSALATTAALLFAAAPGALALFPLLRVLQGVAYSMFFVANFTLVVDLVPAARRGEALGIFGISGLTSTAVGPALGEAIVRAWGFRAFFLATAALGLLTLAVVARLPQPTGRPAGGPGLTGLLRSFAAAPRLPMALGFAFGLGLGGVFTFVPTYAAALGIPRIGLFALAYSAGALTVRMTGSQLIDRIGRRPVIVPALAVQAAGALLLAALAWLVGRAGLPATPLLALVGVLAGVAHGFLYPALSALVMDVTPDEGRGRTIGLFSAFILSGQASGAIVFGSLAHAVGYPPMFAILAACLASACGLALRLRA